MHFYHTLPQVRTFCQAASVFLETWHSQDRTLSTRHSAHLSTPSLLLPLSLPLLNSLIPPNSLLLCRHQSLDHPVCPTMFSQLNHSFKCIHFVRLLSFVLSQLDSRDVPVSLLSRELSSLTTVVTHQSMN